MFHNLILMQILVIAALIIPYVPTAVILIVPVQQYIQMVQFL